MESLFFTTPYTVLLDAEAADLKCKVEAACAIKCKIENPNGTTVENSPPVGLLLGRIGTYDVVLPHFDGDNACLYRYLSLEVISEVSSPSSAC